MCTELEKDILNRLGERHRDLAPLLAGLTVIERKLTGAGSYTRFKSATSSQELQSGYLALDLLISVPGVPNGLGAALACEGGQPVQLEIFTYGNDDWNGSCEGYSFAAA